jgi:hypothetical protein
MSEILKRKRIKSVLFIFEMNSFRVKVFIRFNYLSYELKAFRAGLANAYG